TFIAPFAGEIIVGGAEINRAQTSLPELPLPAQEARTIGGPKEIQSRRSVFRPTLKLSTTAQNPRRSLRGEATSHAKVARMCVNGRGSSLFGRAEFLAALAVAATPLFAGDIADAVPLQSAKVQ